jgi:uncharacterized protein YodC (DUF2158 family)
MTRFRSGDCVKLKDGTGPEMMLIDALEGERLRCLWVDHQGRIQYSRHSADHIERVANDSTPLRAAS